jgi:hypothetical protein
MDQRIESFLRDALALAGKEPDAAPARGSEPVAPGEKVFGALLAIAGVGIILTGHWATTDDMIADLIAGGLMLAFGVLVLLMWSFQR